MFNLDILEGHNVSEIKYYRLEIDVSSYADSLETRTEVNTTPSKNSLYRYHEYVIDKYDVDIIVNENNSLDITEKITAYFNIPKHGIFRTIPLKNTIRRLDGTTSTNRAKISNVVVNNDFVSSKEGGNYKLKIGSANSTLTGEQTYVIKYTYSLGKDPMKNYDELYYNIIGNEWDTVIGNVTFSIKMPKDFDSSKLGFSSGRKGLIDNSRVKYNVSENKITGNYNGILEVGEALTVRCELPEGYFVGEGFAPNFLVFIMFIVPILGLIISFLIWYKFGHDDKIIETVEFYPPDNLNSLEIGYFYKGRAEDKDVTSLLIFLANKGYIEITDDSIDLNSKKINPSEDSKNNANRKIEDLKIKLDEERKNNPNSPKIKYYEHLLDVYTNTDTPINYEQYGLKSSIDENNKKNENKFLIRKIKI